MENKKRTCDECLAYDHVSWQCRRHNPVIVELTSHNKAAFEQGTQVFGSHWPQVSLDDWCLDFVPKNGDEN